MEKKNLENERGTVFDPDAPKTGPLPGMAGYDEEAAKQAQAAEMEGSGMPGMPDFGAKSSDMVKLGSDDINDSQEVNNTNTEITDKRTLTKLSSFFQPRATSSSNRETMDHSMKFLPNQVNVIKNSLLGKKD